jgi:carbonic anhydrase/acetyltransferase-like protein (isoleucine patch superfamily)
MAIDTFMMVGAQIHTYKGVSPDLGKDVFLASGAQVIGDVHLGDQTNLWFNAVVRGDCNYVRIGKRVNIQDGVCIHVTHTTGPTFIEDDVTIGHNATIHACTIKKGCLIGMGATVLDGAVISENSLVGAGALVTPGKTFEPGSLIVGSPAKAVRKLTEKELNSLQDSVTNYLEYIKGYKSEV